MPVNLELNRAASIAQPVRITDEQVDAVLHAAKVVRDSNSHFNAAERAMGSLTGRPDDSDMSRAARLWRETHAEYQARLVHAAEWSDTAREDFRRLLAEIAEGVR